MPADRPLLEVDELVVEYAVDGGPFGGSQTFAAVTGISFSIASGETLALVGESGCGKSTVARAIVGLVRPSRGSIRFDGEDVAALPRRARRRLGADVQMVFQDPYSSLHPRMTAGHAIAEGWRVHPERAPAERERALTELLERVGLPGSARERYPHEFSGGQRQRISIARALALSPRLVVLDEPVSALDVSIQAQILVLLEELQRDLDLSYLLISHDLDVVGQISDRVVTMYLGTIFETGETLATMAEPRHPYTEALLASAPELDRPRDAGREQARLHGDMPSPLSPPSGCRLRTRCGLAETVCVEQVPALVPWPDGRTVACHVRNRALG